MVAPEMFEGDVYAAQNLTAVPGTLASAIPSFALSGFAAESLSGGVRDHYAHFYSTEVAAYDAAVTDWERARYFDRI
jgi:glutamine synthetase